MPLESPTAASSLAKRLVQGAVLGLRRPGIAMRMLQPRALLQMHEHVNFFTDEAIRALYAASGLTVLSSGTYPVNTNKIGPVPLPAAQMLWGFGER